MKKTKRSSKRRRVAPTYKGLPLVDASGDMEICVTKQDVSMSKKNDPANCAAANAIKRTIKTEAEVHISRVYVKHKNRWVRFMTPESVSREITSFDRSAIFEPGTYVLKAPTKSNRLGAHTRNYDTGPHTTTKRPARHHTVNIRESAH